jgi:hypothetical protein
MAVGSFEPRDDARMGGMDRHDGYLSPRRG